MADATSPTCTGCSRVYSWYATDRHRPRTLIVEAGKPRSAAVVAAPILKLWGRMWRCPSLARATRRVRIVLKDA